MTVTKFIVLNLQINKRTRNKLGIHVFGFRVYAFGGCGLLLLLVLYFHVTVWACINTSCSWFG